METINNIITKYSNFLNDIKISYINSKGLNTKNSDFVKWYKNNYNQNKNKYKKTFADIRKMFYYLSLNNQIKCICNFYTVKPLIHEISEHKDSELHYHLPKFNEIEVYNGWAIQFGDLFTIEECLECYQNDLLLRGKKGLVYGKQDVRYGLTRFSRREFRNYVMTKILKGERLNLPKTLVYNEEKFLKTKEVFYLINENVIKVVVNKTLLDITNGVTFPPCAFTEGPFFEMKEDDPLPYDVLMGLKTDFTKLPLEERRQIIKDNFRVKFYK